MGSGDDLHFPVHLACSFGDQPVVVGRGPPRVPFSRSSFGPWRRPFPAEDLFPGDCSEGKCTGRFLCASCGYLRSFVGGCGIPEGSRVYFWLRSMVTLHTLRFVPVFFVLFLPAPFRRWVHVGWWCGRTTLVVVGFFRRVPFEKGIVVACLPTGGSPSSDQGEGWNPTLASSLLHVSLFPVGGPVATLGAVCSVSPLLPLAASPLVRGGLPRPEREGLVRIHLQGEEEEERKRLGLDPPSHPSPLESTTTQGQPCGWVLGAPLPFDHEQWWWWWRRVVIQTHTKGNAKEKKRQGREVRRSGHRNVEKSGERRGRRKPTPTTKTNETHGPTSETDGKRGKRTTTKPTWSNENEKKDRKIAWRENEKEQGDSSLATQRADTNQTYLQAAAKTNAENPAASAASVEKRTNVKRWISTSRPILSTRTCIQASPSRMRGNKRQRAWPNNKTRTDRSAAAWGILSSAAIKT